MELQIEFLPVAELKQYKNNARKHGKTDVAAIAASIREFGFNDPIGIWGDNVIVEGHGRLMAAIELGLDTVPCIRLDHLTDEQRRAYALAHNRTAELSEWDFDIQAAELADICDIDMSAFLFDCSSFSDEELEALMDSEVQTRNKETHRVTVDCDNEEETSVVGQILEEHGYTPKITNR